MTGITAEKHTSFIEPIGKDNVVMDFSGKELIQGEGDASSFPNGGLRATFEARGYTAWDPTSYAFIKDDTLCIPTAFCSYGGEALDTKTPLLRSMDALDRETRRILVFFGHSDIKRVTPTVGAEQEYFLIDKELYLKRPDLIHCGRTLFGARALKGQSLEDHYYGTIKPRISAFMKELDRELWRLGILAKTKHNEVAPAQHEFAPIFTSVNVAADHNQLTMELMKSIADRHGLACLTHEKPFAGINGNGKHNNWALSTDTGHNLLEPGDTPYDNAQFLLFLTAVIAAVDEYQDLLRASVAIPGNEHRLDAHEAPPAIISIFLGEHLAEILEAIEKDTPYVHDKTNLKMEIGATALPPFPKDATDRNRTSPFAFTGNKFEFRMPGASMSISNPNVVLNTITAEILSRFADILEKSTNFKKDLKTLIKNTVKAHKHIIFNGNNYAPEWVEEASRRGLYNLPDTPSALKRFIEKKNIEIMEKHKVLSQAEIYSRYEILMEHYTKVLSIEAVTLIDMSKESIIPSMLSYQKELAQTVLAKKQVNVELTCTLEKKLLQTLSSTGEELSIKLEALETALAHRKGKNDAVYARNIILPLLEEIRAAIDSLEVLVPKTHWILPTYEDLLYSVY